MADNQDIQETTDSTAQDDGGVATKPRRTRVKPKAESLSGQSAFFEEDEYSLEEYEAMLEMYEETLTNIEEGEIVKAKVLRITDNAVILDVGF
jgi:small subunit ribosomal protein S1